MLARTPEPELMDAPEQAAAYAGADFAVAHGAIAAALLARIGPLQGRVLDLGCGPADIPVRLARACPDCRIDGVDGAAAMLAEGRRRLAAEGLGERIELHHVRLPADPLPGSDYAAVVSNSLLHHLHDPAVLWRSVERAGRSDAAVFVADLARPVDATAVERLVERLAADEPAVLQRDLRASLNAAFTVEEVRAQLAEAGLGLTVEMLDDHHLIAHGWLGAA